MLLLSQPPFLFFIKLAISGANKSCVIGAVPSQIYGNMVVFKVAACSIIKPGENCLLFLYGYLNWNKPRECVTITDFSALNSTTLMMKQDCGEQKSGYYGTATLRKPSAPIPIDV